MEILVLAVVSLGLASVYIESAEAKVLACLGGGVFAAGLIGYSGDIGRFANRDRYAAYNGTAPIEWSSGNPKHPIRRLSRRGNRTLNHVIHIAAVTQPARAVVTVMIVGNLVMLAVGVKLLTQAVKWGRALQDTQEAGGGEVPPPASGDNSS